MATRIDNIVCGVYRVINPKGEIYVGCSRSIYNRVLHYANATCKKQRILHASIVKYGWSEHKLDILMVFGKDTTKYTMNFWESWYWMKFKSEGYTLLNGFRPGSSPCLGRKKSAEENAKFIGANNPVFGKKFPRTDEQKDKYHRGGNNSMYGRRGALAPSSRKVVNTESGVIYETVKDAALGTNYKPNTLSMKLTGYRKNNTPFQYVT